MDADGAVEITDVNLKGGRKVYSMIGTMDELLAEGTHPEAVDRFVRATVTDPGVVLNAKSRLEERYPLIIEVQLQSSGLAATAGTRPKVLPDRLDPLETVVAFWTEREHSEPDDAHRRLLAAAVEAAKNEEEES
jgi:exonuclease SbcD